MTQSGVQGPREESIMGTLFHATTFAGLVLLAACDGGAADILLTTNEPGTFDADWTGDGGSTSESFTWRNNQRAAEYSMDITAASGGSAEVTVEDADGEVVRSFGLEAGVGDDSLDGHTQVGTSGDWTITIEIDDFTGDGTVSIGGANPDDL
jgi:hypothetical protein